jgi:hypothetical protein
LGLLVLIYVYRVFSVPGCDGASRLSDVDLVAGCAMQTVYSTVIKCGIVGVKFGMHQ